MPVANQFRAIGLMSGTSMDGIDAAVLETDGDARLTVGPHTSTRYPPELRGKLLRLPASGLDVASIEREVTDLQCQAVLTLCASRNVDLGTIDVIGFHGQTIKHEPQEGRTWQLGDGQRMADALGRVVVNKFRQNDMNHGGQGAPFAPAYHRAMVRSCGLEEPIAVLNIGGVSNVTLIDGELLYACDCGPGNALIDDWVSAHCGVPYDDGGQIAARGAVDERALATLLSSSYFQQSGPKSLDRNAFSMQPVSGLSPQAGAATLSAFTAAAVAVEAQRLQCNPKQWVVVGGGRLNEYLLAQLRQRLAAPVRIAEDLGWKGDAIEAQAFGYLAVRSMLKLPLSWPSTTGVSEPVTGGVQWDPAPSNTVLQGTRAVLFDLDGTLLDTAPDMAGALNQLLQEQGRAPLPFESIRLLVSHGATALVSLAFAEAVEPAFGVLRARFLEIYRARLAVETRLYEGIAEALDRLESRGILWGIVTNKPGWLTEPLLEHFALRQRARVIVSGDTLAQRKPHPAPLLHAAEKLGVAPAECIYIGDAERDVLAAQAAGMQGFVALFGYIPANERPHEWPASGWLDTPLAMAALLARVRTCK
jgi:anhydro-N-acetylmuramic acid kinase